jgi:hypothetical protein
MHEESVRREARRIGEDDHRVAVLGGIVGQAA